MREDLQIKSILEKWKMEEQYKYDASFESDAKSNVRVISLCNAVLEFFEDPDTGMEITPECEKKVLSRLLFYKEAE